MKVTKRELKRIHGADKHWVVLDYPRSISKLKQRRCPRGTAPMEETGVKNRARNGEKGESSSARGGMR